MLSATLLSAASCGIQNRSLQRYTGTMTSTRSDCPPTTATLSLQNDTVTFAPSEGTWVVSGKLTNGMVEATRSRPGVEHRMFTTTLRATISDTGVGGIYTTPYCTFSVALKRL